MKKIEKEESWHELEEHETVKDECLEEEMIVKMSKNSVIAYCSFLKDVKIIAENEYCKFTTNIVCGDLTVIGVSGIINEEKQIHVIGNLVDGDLTHKKGWVSAENLATGNISFGVEQGASVAKANHSKKRMEW